MAKPTPEALAAVVREVFSNNIEITDMRRVTGGASRETWLFDAVHDSTVHPLVLRRDPAINNSTTDRSTEYELIAAAHAAGVAVPRVVALVRPEHGLGSGFMMQRVDGETIPRKILRDDDYAAARSVLTAQCATTLAAVHAVPVASLPKLDVQGAEAQLKQWRKFLDGFNEPHPAFELALRWMRERIPPARAPQLVHGDYRNGNFIVGPEGLRSVLDWELAHLGDPIEDLGWFCVRAWRFGNNDKPAGGFGSITELLDAYERAGGRRPSDDELRFWIALGTLKWGGICMVQAFTHLNGAVRSVELAAIGRRVAENEWDLLNILDGEI